MFRPQVAAWLISVTLLGELKKPAVG